MNSVSVRSSVACSSLEEPTPVTVIVLGRPELEPAIRAAVPALSAGFDPDQASHTHSSGPNLLVIGCDGRRDWTPHVKGQRASGSVQPILVAGHDRPCAHCAAVLEAGADAWLPEAPASLLTQLLEHNVPPLWRRAGARWQVACAGVRFEAVRCVAFFNDEAVHLRPRQFGLLSYLAARAGSWVSERELLKEGLGVSQKHETAIVRVHLSALRRALGPLSGCVQSRRGLGYRFVSPTS